MDAIRIIHHDEGEHGWSFESPDIPGLVGGADTLIASRTHADEAVRFHRECEAEERGDPTPFAWPVEHFAPIAA